MELVYELLFYSRRIARADVAVDFESLEVVAAIAEDPLTLLLDTIERTCGMTAWEEYE